jgi:exodeoxyribonuclease-3
MIKSIISFNVNGIRSAISKGLNGWIEGISADILCFQEIKAQLQDLSLTFFEEAGYHCFTHAAEKKGYSGVMTLSREIPERVTAGMGKPEYDGEGRVLRTDFKDFTLVNVYMPSGTTGNLRQTFKMKFLSEFQQYIDLLCREKAKILVCGDFNIWLSEFRVFILLLCFHTFYYLILYDECPTIFRHIKSCSPG